MAKHEVSKQGKLNEEEYSVPATLVGMAAATGASAMVTVALKQMNIPVKGIQKILVPVATFGIAHWVSNEAMMAAADETESTIEGIKALSAFVKGFMKQYKNEKKEVKDDELE